MLENVMDLIKSLNELVYTSKRQFHPESKKVFLFHQLYTTQNTKIRQKKT